MVSYTQYQSTNEEWIGDIPESWRTIKIKYLNDSDETLFLDGDWIESNVIVDEGIRYLTTGNIGPGYYKEQGRGFISEQTFNELNCTEVFPGDLVASRLNKPIGRACIIPDLGYRIIVAVDNVIIRPKRPFDRQYLMYVMNDVGFSAYTDLISRGATMQRISRGQLGRIVIPFPSGEEQTQIAKFLNHQTGLIDQIIEKKEQLIEKLKEYKQAIINEVVTKGLDPNVPMKDCGIEWLREIPEHWEIIQFRHCFTTKKGLTITKENLKEEGIPCVNYGEIHSKFGFEVDPSKNSLKCVSEEYVETNEKSMLSNGDFIFADTSEDIEGAGNFTHLNSNIPTFAGYHTIIAQMVKSNNYRYFAYYMDSLAFRSQIRSQVKGVKVFSITNKILKSTMIAFPSESEQKLISDFLDTKSVVVQNSIQLLRSSVTKLKVYRKSLISEAVTGKIDVRNWKPTEA